MAKTEKKDSGKKKVAKLKGKKLEDRIAPGMVGGGIIDPGMSGNAPDAPPDTAQQDGPQGEQTQVDQTPQPQQDASDPAANSPAAQSPSHSGDQYSQTDSNDRPTDSAQQGRDSSPNDYQSVHQADSPSHVAPVDEAHTWKEPDWVTPHADGSVHIQPPAGVSVDHGIANFPVATANEHLPLPENVSINANGSVTVDLPQGTQFHEASNSLIVPAGGVDPAAVPEHFNPVENPDGSVSVSLPEHGAQFDAQTNSLNLDNNVVNQVTPSYMEVQNDGSVSVTLPENHTVAPDGSIELPADATAHFDNPPHEAIQDIDWAHQNADGSVGFDVPQNVEVGDGIMTVPHDAISALPIPDDMTINADGSIDTGVPEGTTYNADANSLTFPVGTMDHVPEGMDSFVGPDGSTTICLPEGCQYDADAGTVHMDNHWANEIVPDSVHVGTDGSVSIELPQGTQYDADGSHFTIPADQTNFLDGHSPDYIHDADYSTPHADGSYTVAPPEGATVSDGTLSFSADAVSDHVPVPDSVTINTDGTMTIEQPEGTTYDADSNALTFPSGAVQMSEIPEGVTAQLNPDGTITAELPTGITYDADSGSISLDNYWANEVAPDNVSISAEGGVTVELPETTTFNADGSFTVPAEQAGFLETPAPEYVAQGPDWVSMPSVEGPVQVEPPAYVSVDPEAGTMTMPVANLTADFAEHIPDDVTLNADGTMSVQAPPGTSYDPAANLITVPPGGAYLNEIPPELNAYQNPDGSISVPLQQGMSFDAETGSMQFDNYWTNELAPPNVEVSDTGSVTVDLPAATQFHDGGSFTIPADHTDFMDTPAPEYAAQGPDWVSMPATDGPVQVEPPTYVAVDPEAGTFTIPVTNLSADFSGQIPEEVTLNPDGTMSVQAPEGTTYDAAANLINIPAGEANLGEIPAELNAYQNPDGSISVPMEQGMSFDADTGSVQFDNYWTNELAPPNVEISDTGSVTVDLPSSTEFHDDDSFTIPAGQTDFIETPTPTYVVDGPDWVSMPVDDGPIYIESPPYLAIDPDLSSMSMPIAQVNIDFANQIPENVTLESDGTMSVQAPAGTTYDPSANLIDVPAGEANINEIPPELNAYSNPDGSISVPVQQGMSFDAETGSVQFDNYWTNELAPPSVEISDTGSVTVDLPPDTQFHDGGAITIPADQADFIENPPPALVQDGPEWVSMPDSEGPVQIEPPAYVTVDAEAGTATMPIANLSADFSERIPDEVTFNPDGTMSVQAPEGTTYDAASNLINIPAGEANLGEIPAELNAYANPDGSISFPLEQGMSYDADSSSLQFNNDWTNELTPPNLEISADGNVTVDLPAETQYHEGGEITIPAAQADFIDNPVPEYVAQGPDWVSMPDSEGPVHVEPPAYVTVDAEAGTATMPVANLSADFSERIPEEVTLQPDGTMSVQAPEGTTFDATSNLITVPAGEASLGEIPAELNAYQNPDGSISVPMEQGMSFDADTGTVQFDNYWTNELAPPSVEISDTGSVTIDLPPATDFHDNGSFTISAEQSDFDTSPPNPTFGGDGPDWVSMPDSEGPVQIEPPAYVTVDAEAGTATMPIANLSADFSERIPDEVTFNPDGTMSVQAPEGTTYDAASNLINIPAGEANLGEIPAELNAYANPDGSISFPLEQGMSYDADSSSLQFNNDWTNELTPPNLEISADGNVTVDLPAETQYHEGGEITIPAAQADFIDNPVPEYVAQGPDWVSMPDSEGPVHVEPPAYVTVDAEAGTATMPIANMTADFSTQIPEGMTFHADGTMEVSPPPGTTYDAGANTLTIPAGAANLQEIPPVVGAYPNPDGSITVPMHDGMNYDAGSGTVQMDNHWTNLCTPSNIEVHADGNVTVNLPNATQFHDNGTMTIPAEQTHFIDNPPPAIVAEGPAWVDMHSSGAIHVEPPPTFTVDPNQGVMSAPFTSYVEHFPNMVPHDMVVHTDGTATIPLPPGTDYNPAASTLTMPAGTVHMNEIPSGITANLNPNGSITVNMPTGMTYDAGNVHMTNAFVNQIVPPNIEITPQGHVQVDLPPGTQHFGNGSYTIPPQSSNFMQPTYPSPSGAMGTMGGTAGRAA